MFCAYNPKKSMNCTMIKMWFNNAVTRFLVVITNTRSRFDTYHNSEQILSRKNSIEQQDVTAKVIGEFGKWQLMICIFMTLIKLPNAWYQMNIIFMAPPQEFWCAKPENMKCSEEEWREICSPIIQKNQCLIYDPEILRFFPSMEKKLIRLVACKKFVYNQTQFRRTITSEWDLVCDRHWLIHLTQCLIMWGFLVGSIVFGILADKIGRRKPLMISIFMQAFFGIFLYFVNTFKMFLLNCFLLAVASGGVGTIPFVLTMEVVSGKYRTSVPVLYQLPFGLGTAVMAGLAYWLRDWRKLELALGLISAIYSIYWFIIPESPRWLLAKGQTRKALRILRTAARINNMEFNRREILRALPKNKKPTKDPTFIMFLKSSNMRLKTVLLSIDWFCTGLSFYTFSQYLGSMGSNIFLTVAITGIISTLGGLVCLVIIKKFDRRTTIAIGQLVTGVSFLLILIAPKILSADEWVRILFAGLGFAGMSAYIPALNLYSGELFPTLGRNVGMSGVMTFARIASMAAPAIVYLDTFISDLPLMLLSVMAFAQIFLLIPLPETQGSVLPDTIEEAELF